MSIGIKAVGKRVILERIKAETKTESELYVPEDTSTKTERGIILAVGNIDDEVEVGDTVLFMRHQGVELKHNNRSLLVIGIDHIEAIV